MDTCAERPSKRESERQEGRGGQGRTIWNIRREVWEQISDYIIISPLICFVTLDTFIMFEPIPFVKHSFLPYYMVSMKDHSILS